MNLIVAIIAFIAAIIFFVFAKKPISKDVEDRKEYPRYYNRIALGCLIVAIIFILLGSIYFQDPGEVSVVRNITGSLSHSTSEAGMHFKAPWQDVIKYDVRNITMSFIGESAEDYTGGQALGPHITINDSGGASADMDVQIQYSLNPENALDLYTKYGDQENFARQVVAAGTRTYARDVAGKLSTIDILTSRGTFSQALAEALTKAWEDDGVIVENVAVQDIRYPESIKEKYAEAQAAEIAKAKAVNEQEAAKVEAETLRITAEGEANANRALSESLTQDVLMARYIEALKEIGNNGNLIVVPEGSMPLINTGTSQ